MAWSERRRPARDEGRTALAVKAAPQGTMRTIRSQRVTRTPTASPGATRRLTGAARQGCPQP